MEAGARRPLLVTEDGTVWVGYRARVPEAPGLDKSPAFSVLRFDHVTELQFGPPSDLKVHDFYRVHPFGRGQRRWIMTFADQTLYVCAKTARAFPIWLAPTAEDAIAFAQSQ